MPLNPGEAALDDPAALVAAQQPTVLGLAHSRRSVRRDDFGALVAQLCIELIAVVRTIADQILRLGLDHVEVEA